MNVMYKWLMEEQVCQCEKGEKTILEEKVE